jgi:hypothetical protein
MEVNIPNIVQTIGDTRELVIDVKTIFKTLYGYAPESIDTTSYNAQNGATQQNAANIAQFSKKTVTKWGSNLYGLTDLMGREVFCPMIITSGGVDYNFPHVVVGFKAPVIYKETPMVERGGSVIEEVALGAIRISVKGFLIGAYGQFPDEEIDALANLRSSKSPKYLKCALTDRFLLQGDQVVMLDLNVPEKTGFQGSKAFSFDLLEDSILDLYSVI